MPHTHSGPAAGFASIMLAGLMLAACGGDQPAEILVPERRVTGDAYRAAPRFALAPIGTLCAPDATPCDLSAQVSAAEGLHGDVLVWEFAHAIRRYDAAGVQRPNLGGIGDGDGEYTLAVAAGPATGGIRVFDVARMRVVQYDSSGVFSGVRQVRVSQATRQAVLWDGKLALFTVQSQSSGGGSDFRAVLTDGNGSSDTLAVVPLPGYVNRAGRLQELPGLFEAQPAWNLTPTGEVLFTDGVEYNILGFHGGKPMRRLVVEHPPRAVQQDENTREAAAMQSRVAPNLKPAVDDAVKRVAKNHPSITQLIGLPDGGVLAREAPRAAGDSVRWSWFNPDWQISGYIETAESDRVLLLQEKRFLLLSRHSDGVALRWYAIP